jgi:hypothetical protein
MNSNLKATVTAKLCFLIGQLGGCVYRPATLSILGMIWSATSRTPDPGSVIDAQQGIARLVIADLAKLNIIRSGK